MWEANNKSNKNAISYFSIKLYFFEDFELDEGKKMNNYINEQSSSSSLSSSVSASCAPIHISGKEVTPIEYFEEVIIKYNKTDIEFLINTYIDNPERQPAGPLLAIVANGLMTMGKLYSNYRTDGDKTVNFINSEMGFNESMSRLLYEIVRCGITHIGIPYYGVEFFVFFDPKDFKDIKNRFGKEMEDYFCTKECIKIIPGKYDKNEKNIKLDVSKLAFKYLRAIERIHKNPAKKIQFLPEYMKEKKTLENLLFKTIYGAQFF